jgi:hypothetical protein
MLSLALAVLLAQDVNPYAGVRFDNPMGGWLDAATWQRIGARLTPKPGTRKPSPRAPLEATDFTPVQPRTAARAIVEGSKVSKEQGQALIEGLNAGLDAFEQQARKNNVAYALAFLIGASMQTLNEKEVSDAESDMLAQAINDELAASPSFKKLKPKQKQLLYETSIVLGALIGGMAAQAAEANDPELKKQAQAMARSALQPFQSK